MKKILLLITALSWFVFAQGQLKPETATQLSILTKKYLNETEKLSGSGRLPEGFAYRKINNIIYVSALIKVGQPLIAQEEIENAEAIIGTRAGNIWSVQIPANSVKLFCNLQGIACVELDEAVFPNLNVARQTTRVDSVHAGINLPMAYSGKGVILGVIDFGFDYNHPSFYDTLHANYRIKRVWELNANGTPPVGYAYGNEITDTTLIKAQGTDDANQMHGTSTAGIAGGSGFGSTPQANRFRGMAYESDLVLVGVRRDSIEQQWLQGSFTDFLDGINYIFNYATSVGKPAVVNISWGSQSGAHDGNSLFNQACNNISGPGKIVVMSAGNEGTEKIHLSKTFTVTDTIVNTFLKFSSNAYKRTWVDTWGEPGKTFCAQVTLYHNNIAGNTTGYFCIDDSIHDLALIGSSGNDTCKIQFISQSITANGKPRMTIDIHNKAAADSVGVSIVANDGTIHAWNEYYYYGFPYGFQCSFDSLNKSWAVSGNTISTVSDMGSGDSVIMVGAYCSKSNFTDINGSSWSYNGYVLPGRIVPFSSRGPLANSVVKPDITAPGLTICAAVSSYDMDYTPTGANSSLTIASWFDAALSKTFYYAEFSGTSASAPCVSGIIALMMQAYPDLSPQQAKDIIFATAIHDVYTGPFTPQGNNNWGHGKINAYQAIKMLMLQTGIYHYEGITPDCVLYPNPNNGVGVLNMQATLAGDFVVEVFDIKGSMVHNGNWNVTTGENKYTIDLSALNTGAYLVKVSSAKGFITIKMITR